MPNFPGKWFDFINSKEIKRMRQDINNSLSLKIEISTSIILTIVAFFFSEHIKKLDFKWQLIICSFFCLIVLAIFFTTYIIKWVAIRKKCNIVIKGKDAVSIFDDEIVYNILVATEYYNSIEKITDNCLKDELVNFYNIEIQYYLTKSVKMLVQFNSNYALIFGDGINKIPFERAQNILNLINSIITCSKVELEDSLSKELKEFGDFLIRQTKT